MQLAIFAVLMFALLLIITAFLLGTYPELAERLTLWLRGQAFGWFCSLRCFHRARQPYRIVPVYAPDEIEPMAATIGFRCICGARTEQVVDYRRGGRVIVPHCWRVK